MPAGPAALANSPIGGSGHGGAITAGSAITKNQASIGLARIGDPANCTTHGSTTVATGSGTRKDLDGKFFARVNDTTACGAIILSGDPTITIRD